MQDLYHQPYFQGLGFRVYLSDQFLRRFGVTQRGLSDRFRAKEFWLQGVVATL